jgi:hypothetical protein
MVSNTCYSELYSRFSFSSEFREQNAMVHVNFTHFITNLIEFIVNNVAQIKQCGIIDTQCHSKMLSCIKETIAVGCN